MEIGNTETNTNTIGIGTGTGRKLYYHPKDGWVWGYKTPYKFTKEEREAVIQDFVNASAKERESLRWKLVGVSMAYINQETIRFFEKFGLTMTQFAYEDLLTSTISTIAEHITKYDKKKSKMTFYLSFYIQEAQRKYIMREVYPEISQHYYAILTKIRRYVAEKGIDPNDYPPTEIMDETVEDIVKKYPRLSAKAVRAVLLYMMSFPRSIESDLFGNGRQTFAEVVSDNKPGPEDELQSRVILRKFAYCLAKLKEKGVKHYEIKVEYLQSLMHDSNRGVIQGICRKLSDLSASSESSEEAQGSEDPEETSGKTKKEKKEKKEKISYSHLQCICKTAVQEFREIWEETSDKELFDAERAKIREREEETKLRKAEKIENIENISEDISTPDVSETTVDIDVDVDADNDDDDVTNASASASAAAASINDKIREYAQKEIARVVDETVREIVAGMDLEAMIKKAVAKFMDKRA